MPSHEERAAAIAAQIRTLRLGDDLAEAEARLAASILELVNAAIREDREQNDAWIRYQLGP